MKHQQTTLTKTAAKGASHAAVAGCCLAVRAIPLVKSRCCADAQAMYGKTATNTTEGLPPSGMRVYVTNEAVLRQQFEASLAAAG